jgi:hypothetical protein
MTSALVMLHIPKDSVKTQSVVKPTRRVMLNAQHLKESAVGGLAWNFRSITVLT